MRPEHREDRMFARCLGRAGDSCFDHRRRHHGHWLRWRGLRH
jgi:hypothetical protein